MPISCQFPPPGNSVTASDSVLLYFGWWEDDLPLGLVKYGALCEVSYIFFRFGFYSQYLTEKSLSEYCKILFRMKNEISLPLYALYPPPAIFNQAADPGGFFHICLRIQQCVGSGCPTLVRRFECMQCGLEFADRSNARRHAKGGS